MPDISIVVPMYNAENGLSFFCQKLMAAITEVNQSFEVIFVDDASTDKTAEKFIELKKSLPSGVSLLRLERNHGQYAATLCGMMIAKGVRL